MPAINRNIIHVFDIYKKPARAHTPRGRRAFYQRWKSHENSIPQKIWTWTWALLVNLFYCCWCADSIWFYNWFLLLLLFSLLLSSKWSSNVWIQIPENIMVSIQLHIRANRVTEEQAEKGSSVRWRIAKNLPYECVLVSRRDKVVSDNHSKQNELASEWVWVFFIKQQTALYLSNEKKILWNGKRNVVGCELIH